MKKISIFASGSGTNAEAIIRYFEDVAPDVGQVVLVVSNKPGAQVRERAARHGVPTMVIPTPAWGDSGAMEQLCQELRERDVALIALAGFMLRIPEELLEAYPGKIVNIHPSLLPLHGGKGMYGRHVHEAVLASGEERTGITIHLVDGRLDAGTVLLQATMSVATEADPEPTAETLAERVHVLEHLHYAPTIHQLLV